MAADSTTSSSQNALQSQHFELSSPSTINEVSPTDLVSTTQPQRQCSYLKDTREQHLVAEPQPLQRSSPKNDDDEVYEEARLVFNKTIGGHYRHGKTGYREVGVLCLTWKDDDMQCKASEVDQLRDLFDQEFNFKTDYFEIPSNRWQTALQKKLSDFCWEYDSPDCLGIIYYGGHGYEGTDTKKFKLSAKVRPDGDGDPNVFFNDILNCLQLPASDQLVIIDCCYAARAFARDFVGGKRKFDLLTSAAADAKSPAPILPGSFTKALNDCLRSLLQKCPNGFSTSHLFREIYHTVGDIKPVLFDLSRHNYGKIWLRPQRPVTATNSERDGTYLHLTVRLNEGPDPAIINELATSLQFLPHVNQVRYDHLYAPKGQLDDFFQSVLFMRRLRPLIRRLKDDRLAKKNEALKHGDHRDPPASSWVKMLLKQVHNPIFGVNGPEAYQDHRKKRSTWPPAAVDEPSKLRAISKRLLSIKYNHDTRLSGAFVFDNFSRRVKTTDGSMTSVKASSNGLRLMTLPLSVSQMLATNEQQSQLFTNAMSERFRHFDLIRLVMWCSMLFTLVFFCTELKSCM
ncbi:hypothetical protein N7G274_009710 [Stereocaulon virgatum]|uniref:Uncharacterized protein n=1 Tax=Stereocaulon virgatum TaxID=373712 RepID=A0ABR3ZVG4_9LECA